MPSKKGNAGGKQAQAKPGPLTPEEEVKRLGEILSEEKAKTQEVSDKYRNLLEKHNKICNENKRLRAGGFPGCETMSKQELALKLLQDKLNEQIAEAKDVILKLKEDTRIRIKDFNGVFYVEYLERLALKETKTRELETKQYRLLNEEIKLNFQILMHTNIMYKMCQKDVELDKFRMGNKMERLELLKDEIEYVYESLGYKAAQMRLDGDLEGVERVLADRDRKVKWLVKKLEGKQCRTLVFLEKLKKVQNEKIDLIKEQKKKSRKAIRFYLREIGGDKRLMKAEIETGIDEVEVMKATLTRYLALYREHKLKQADKHNESASAYDMDGNDGWLTLSPKSCLMSDGAGRIRIGEFLMDSRPTNSGRK